MRVSKRQRSFEWKVRLFRCVTCWLQVGVVAWSQTLPDPSTGVRTTGFHFNLLENIIGGACPTAATFSFEHNSPRPLLVVETSGRAMFAWHLLTSFTRSLLCKQSNRDAAVTTTRIVDSHCNHIDTFPPVIQSELRDARMEFSYGVSFPATALVSLDGIKYNLTHLNHFGMLIFALCGTKGGRLTLFCWVITFSHESFRPDCNSWHCERDCQTLKHFNGGKRWLNLTYCPHCKHKIWLETACMLRFDDCWFSQDPI